MDVVLAGIPRSGTTMLSRALEGARPGSTWIKNPQVVFKTHMFAPNALPQSCTRAIFLYGDPILSAISMRKHRWERRSFRVCGQSRDDVDVFARDDLNFEKMFDTWVMQEHPYPLLWCRYSHIHEHIRDISEFVGFSVELPRKLPRTTKYTDITEEELASAQRTYAQLQRKMASVPTFFITRRP